MENVVARLQLSHILVALQKYLSAQVLLDAWSAGIRQRAPVQRHLF